MRGALELREGFRMAQHILAEAQVCKGLLKMLLHNMIFWDMSLSPPQQILSPGEVPNTCKNRA